MNPSAPFRGVEEVASLAKEIARVSKTPLTIMEICGGQTHAILRNGLQQLLPPHLELLHGPGCPVCVTPSVVLDTAIWWAMRCGATICTFGDMMRVPGVTGDLLYAKSQGGDVRVVYSPLDAVRLASENPSLQVVFLGIGFETTAPANAMAARMAKDQGLSNFSLLVSQVLVPPAICSLLEEPSKRIGGFLAAGHVCAVTGTEEYRPIAAKYGVPIVVTGFDPVDILCGILRCVLQKEEGRAEVENFYSRIVRKDGNPVALALLAEVFEVCDREWRGIGKIAASGLALRKEFDRWNAEKKFPRLPEELVGAGEARWSRCRSGEVLQGLIKPTECPYFGKECSPENPIGATMVSSEGACAAYYRYRR